MFVQKISRPALVPPKPIEDKEEKKGVRTLRQVSPATVPQEQATVEQLKFNISRLLISAVLLIVILSFAVGTAFYKELSQIHTMLVHAFELILGLIAGLLGGEVIAKSGN